MTEGNHYSREIPCYVCGSLVITTAVKTMCPECRVERARERQKCRTNKYIHTIDPDVLQVVYDPIPIEDGGFRKGATFNLVQIRYMLWPSYDCLRVGTKFKNGRGQLFEIIYGKKGGKKLVIIPTITK